MNKLEFDESVKVLEVGVIGSSRLFNSNGNDKSYVLGNISFLYDQDRVLVEGSDIYDISDEVMISYPNNNFGILRLDDKLSIENKEGFIAFVCAARDKFRKRDVSYDDFYEALERVTSVLISKYNLRVSTDEWMRSNNQLSKKYFNTIKKNAHLTFRKTGKKAYEQNCNQTLRRNLIEFDNCVNPFMSNKYSSSQMEDALRKMEISFDTNNSDGSVVTISDLETNNYVTYRRANDGFSYGLTYKDSSDMIFSLFHTFNLDNSNSMYDGEYIKYEFGSNDYNITPTTTIYNLTHNIIQHNSGAIVDASVDDKIEMYQHLITANAYAAQVTLDNVSKGYSYSKK